MNLEEYKGAIEAMLFASGESVGAAHLAKSLGVDERTVKTLINDLSDKYEKEKRGIKIIQINEAYQMCTNGVYYDYVAGLVKTPAKKNLTQPLLETLAIVAYKQPVTRLAVEEIRGVSADHAINRLIEYGLVCETGRAEGPGRPILFGTTEEFLKYYGYRNLNELPQLEQGLSI